MNKRETVAFQASYEKGYEAGKQSVLDDTSYTEALHKEGQAAYHKRVMEEIEHRRKKNDPHNSRGDSLGIAIIYELNTLKSRLEDLNANE